MSTLIVASAIVMFWRGAWGLLDMYLLPENPAASFIISIAIGVALLAFNHKLKDLA